MPGYYISKLAGDRLEKVYRLAGPRVCQYLEAEIEHVISLLSPGDGVLELGCGYGRVLGRLAPGVAQAVGIDNSLDSLLWGLTRGILASNCELVCADALFLPFSESTFDSTICIQNGISAFKVDRLRLIKESLRVTKVGGRIIFSSYSPIFWPHRLEWFEAQSAAGLLGTIDYNRTGDGVIVCTDGFSAHTVGEAEFRSLAHKLGTEASIEEVDESSLFGTIVKT